MKTIAPNSGWSVMASAIHEKSHFERQQFHILPENVKGASKKLRIT